MPTQDRTGTRYEKLLAFSLEHLGFVRTTSIGRNYLHPGKQSEIVIPGTYIQPDIVLRKDQVVTAVLYSTHWSNTRDSKRKFWRTWEEQAQQRVTLGNSFLAINCVFESLPADKDPMVCTTAAHLPVDRNRQHRPPIQLEGWDPGIGWALVESFDVTILFPKGYEPIDDVKAFGEGDHDATTTKLLRRAIASQPKKCFASHWATLRSIKAQSSLVPRGIPDTHSRFRIGLLHVYLLCKLLRRRANKEISVPQS